MEENTRGLFAVGGNQGQVSAQAQLQLQALLAERTLEDRHRVVHQILWSHKVDVQLGVLPLVARVAQDPVDHLEQLPGAFLDAREVTHLAVVHGTGNARLQKVGVAHYRGERSAQFVRHHGQEVGLRAARVARITSQA